MLPIVAVAAQLLLLRVAWASVYDYQQGKQLLNSVAHLERVFCFLVSYLVLLIFKLFMPCHSLSWLQDFRLLFLA